MTFDKKNSLTKLMENNSALGSSGLSGDLRDLIVQSALPKQFNYTCPVCGETMVQLDLPFGLVLACDNGCDEHDGECE